LVARGLTPARVHDISPLTVYSRNSRLVLKFQPNGPLDYTLSCIRRTEQKEISTSFLGLVATPHKVAKVMGALSPK
jgi:hypothetical protein